VKPRILIIKRADMQFDIRSQRIASSLMLNFDVKIVGISPWQGSNINQETIYDFNYAPLTTPMRVIRKLRREILLRNIGEKDFDNRFKKEKWIHAAAKFIKTNSFDLVVACDIDAISAAVESNTKAIVVGDMHEHAPSELANQPNWTNQIGRYRHWLCGEYLSKVHQLYAVSDSLAEVLETDFDIEKPAVLRNAAPYTNRTRAASDTPPINFIHHGIAAKIRKLEEHAKLATSLGRPYTINMLLQPVEYKYYRYLNELSEIIYNFNIINSVLPSEIISTISQFDAGIYLLEPASQQLRVTLPNKFFEFIQARLPVFSGGLTEMDILVKKFGIGVTLETFDGEEAAEKILKSKDLNWKQIHQNLDYAAYELSLEKEFSGFSNNIKNLLFAKK
jgi:hypothetical protein